MHYIPSQALNFIIISISYHCQWEHQGHKHLSTHTEQFYTYNNKGTIHLATKYKGQRNPTHHIAHTSHLAKSTNKGSVCVV